MSLTPGTRLGIYEVTAKIGEGGMGEVYQAHDTTLDRDVALKVLPEAFTADPDRLARFQREAKVLASLNHPNIGAIYGLEAAGDTQALVLELIEGPTLAERIAEGPVPVEQVVAMVRQMAEALSAAHDAGVIHRDLKPANVKVRPDGTVKVLDFGLAKAVEGAGGDATESPTMTAMSSQAGAIIGTAAYMAPEQARGELVDKRADIWALGCVCYELLSGRRAFEGRTLSDTLASVLARDVDLTHLPDEVPAALRKFMGRCLDKDPTRRLRDAAEGVLQLEEGLAQPVVERDETSAATPEAPLRLWQRPIPALLTIAVALALGAVTVWAIMRPAPGSLVRFSIVPAGTAPLNFVAQSRDLAISPDGTKIVYNGSAGGGISQLNLRPIDQFEAAQLRGGENGVAPFFSPDGEWVGFTDIASGRRLMKVSVYGGPPVTLTQAPTQVRGASWGLDDEIIFGLRFGPISKVSGGGGESQALTTLRDGETGHAWPFIIPGREAVVFVISTGVTLTTGQLAVLDLTTQEITPLGLAGVSPHYVEPGYLVYAAGDGSVRAVPFDVNSLSVIGNPVPLLEAVSVKTSGAANFDVSGDGQMVYALGTGTGGGAQVSLVWVDRQGREVLFEGLDPGNYESFRLSPDSSRLAFDLGRERIWTYDIARGVRNPLTIQTGVSDSNPVWTPDGARVVFSRDNSLFWMSSDGTGSTEELLTRDNASRLVAESWSPDGNYLLFMSVGGGRGVTHLEFLTMDDERTSDVFIDTDRIEGSPDISPDGQWVAYHSDVSERMEVYVQRFPTGGDRQQISTGGGRAPLWSPDGTELFYRNVDGRQVLAVPVTIGQTFTAGVAEVLFEGPYLASIGGVRPWDLDGDGQRFVMAKLGTAGEDGMSPQIQVVLNWFEELKARVPVP